MYHDVTREENPARRHRDREVVRTVGPASTLDLHGNAAEIDGGLSGEDPGWRRHLHRPEFANLSLQFADHPIEEGTPLVSESGPAAVLPAGLEPSKHLKCLARSRAFHHHPMRKPGLIDGDEAAGLLGTDDLEFGEARPVDAVPVGMVAMPMGVDEEADRPAGDLPDELDVRSRAGRVEIRIHHEDATGSHDDAHVTVGPFSGTVREGVDRVGVDDGVNAGRDGLERAAGIGDLGSSGTGPDGEAQNRGETLDPVAKE